MSKISRDSLAEFETHYHHSIESENQAVLEMIHSPKTHHD